MSLPAVSVWRVCPLAVVVVPLHVASTWSLGSRLGGPSSPERTAMGTERDVPPGDVEAALTRDRSPPRAVELLHM